MGHYDECREGYCGVCGQGEGFCVHTKERHEKQQLADALERADLIALDMENNSKMRNISEHERDFYIQDARAIRALISFIKEGVE